MCDVTHQSPWQQLCTGSQTGCSSHPAHRTQTQTNKDPRGCRVGCPGLSSLPQRCDTYRLSTAHHASNVGRMPFTSVRSASVSSANHAHRTRTLPQTISNSASDIPAAASALPCCGNQSRYCHIFDSNNQEYAMDHVVKHVDIQFMKCM
jgi:hypothetical protein